MIWHGCTAMPQSLTNLLIHLVFSTAGREPYLTDPELRREIHHYLGGIVNGKGGHSIAVGGVEDHVHLLFALPKTMPLADMVRDLKRASSIWVKKRDPSLKTFAWQGGYGAFSVGQTETGVITDYIAKQEAHHRKRTFQDEFLAFLEKYKIDYDERFVWE